MSYIIQSIVHCRLKKQDFHKHLAGVLLSIVMMISATESRKVAGQSVTPPSTAPASKPSTPPPRPTGSPRPTGLTANRPH